MARTYEEVSKELNADIPRSDVALRDGGGGRKLSYLEGWKVIDLLNSILGVGNWAYTSDANPVYVDTENKSVHYVAKVRLAVTIGTVNTEFTDYGYGDGKDKVSVGKAHELAIKEAVTDGIKRCAKNLGMRLGLALYDRTQENVSDEATTVPQSRATPAPARTVTPAAKPAQPAVKAAAPNAKENVADNSKETGERETLIQLVGAKSRIAITKKRASVPELVSYLGEKFGVQKKEELTEFQAKEVIQYLDTLLT